MSGNTLVPPKPVPELNIPASDHTVKVSCIDSTTYLSLPIKPFLTPDIKGKEHLTCPAYSFLIEHPSGKRLLFDLGVRKDWENLAPMIVDHAKKGNWTIDIKQNVADILESHSIPVSKGAIDTVIWSHHHWDHTGDMTTFPSSTSLVIGPGFSKQYLPGYPERKDAPILTSDFANRTVREIDIASEGNGLKISRFNAYDYFNDGSFYLLDTPGHSVGHMCGLARTTSQDGKSTFVFMGGDACHHGGEFRPSDYLPLPKEIDPSPIKKIQPVCPGHLLQEIHRNKSATEPFYLVAPGFAHDTEVAEWTIAGLQEFDAQENVLLLTAHDESVLGVVDFYPKSLNDWREKDLARTVRWRFLGDFGEAVQA